MDNVENYVESDIENFNVDVEENGSIDISEDDWKQGFDEAEKYHV